MRALAILLALTSICSAQHINTPDVSVIPYGQGSIVSTTKRDAGPRDNDLVENYITCDCNLATPMPVYKGPPVYGPKQDRRR